MKNNDELRAEIMDTIEVCETYLKDAERHANKAMPAGYAHLFDADGIAFAKAQIAFEKGRLENL